jgi:hypothetical protein
MAWLDIWIPRNSRTRDLLPEAQSDLHAVALPTRLYAPLIPAGDGRATEARRWAAKALSTQLLGLQEAEAAQLPAGRFVHLPTERLLYPLKRPLYLLTALDRDVDIVVRPRPAGQVRAKLRVVSTAA